MLTSHVVDPRPRFLGHTTDIWRVTSCLLTYLLCAWVSHWLVQNDCGFPPHPPHKYPTHPIPRSTYSPPHNRARSVTVWKVCHTGTSRAGGKHTATSLDGNIHTGMVNGPNPYQYADYTPIIGQHYLHTLEGYYCRKASRLKTQIAIA